MIAKCPECDKAISDKAHTCPHCGFPLLLTKFKTAANTGITTSLTHISNGAISMKRIALIVGTHLIKLIIIALLLVPLAIVFRFIMSIAMADMQLRIIINIFLPFFWAPILTVSKRLYGLLPVRILYYISFIFMGIGVLSEYGTLREASFIFGVTNEQVIYAVIAKIFGTICFAFACFPKTPTAPKDDSHNEVTNEHS